MANEAERILLNVLARAQRVVQIRKGLALLLLLILIGMAGHFVYEILPRTYALKITGGDLLSNRHFLARSLQLEVLGRGVALQVVPVHGSQEALEQVNQGQLDFAFIQGGLEPNYPNVTHVATVAPELLHFLVQPGIKDIADLRGKRVNLGSMKGGTRIIGNQVLEFSGLVDGIDYVESNLSAEELLSLPLKRMPEVIVLTSFAPSNIADYLVKQRGYQLLEIPFPSSLSLRLGWVTHSKIFAYMYGVKPAVPSRDIQTVGVNLHLVANKDVDPIGVFRLLESLYSPSMEQRLHMKMDDSMITTPSGFPLSKGTTLYLERNNPLLSAGTLDKIKALFGLILSLASTVLVVFRWFSGPDEDTAPATDDPYFVDLIEQTMQIEARFNTLDMGDKLVRAELDSLRATLDQIKRKAIDKLGSDHLKNTLLVQTLLQLISELRGRLDAAFHARSS